MQILPLLPEADKRGWLLSRLMNAADQAVASILSKNAFTVLTVPVSDGV